MATKSTAKKAVIVTTEHRGVFFGFVKDDKKAPSEITITEMRNVIYWPKEVDGVFGLASNGPNKDTKLGARIKEIKLYKVTSVFEVEPDALKKWKDA